MSEDVDFFFNIFNVVGAIFEHTSVQIWSNKMAFLSNANRLLSDRHTAYIVDKFEYIQRGWGPVQ